MEVELKARAKAADVEDELEGFTLAVNSPRDDADNALEVELDAEDVVGLAELEEEVDVRDKVEATVEDHQCRISSETVILLTEGSCSISSVLDRRRSYLVSQCICSVPAQRASTGSVHVSLARTTETLAIGPLARSRSQHLHKDRL